MIAPDEAPPSPSDSGHEAMRGLSGEGGGGSSAAPLSAPRSSLQSTEPAPEGPQALSSEFAPEERERRIERTASLTLAAPEERIDRVADGIVAATARHEGFLIRSSTSSGDDEVAGGTFELRVPVDELRATLSDLAALGTVRAQSQTGEDLTQPVATAADRLDGARAERRGLLRRLERADSDREARALRRQLDLVSGKSEDCGASSTRLRRGPTTRASR